MSAWTTEKPTGAGWYWWRLYDDEPWQIVRLMVNAGRLFYLRVSTDVEIDSSKGEWAGPIALPKEVQP